MKTTLVFSSFAFLQVQAVQFSVKDLYNGIYDFAGIDSRTSAALKGEVKTSGKKPSFNLFLQVDEKFWEDYLDKDEAAEAGVKQPSVA